MERSQRSPRGRGRRRSRRCPALARCPCGAPSPPQKPDSAPSESRVHPYDPGRSGPWLGLGYWRVCGGTAGQPKSRRMNCPRVSACSKSTFPRTIPCPGKSGSRADCVFLVGPVVRPCRIPPDPRHVEDVPLELSPKFERVPKRGKISNKAIARDHR